MANLLLYFVSIFLICSCATKSKVEEIANGSAAINFEYFDNRILVPVSINNQGPFYMIFDTGGSNMLVPEAASRLNLSMKDAGFGGGAGDSKRKMQLTKVKNYKVGSVELKDQEFLVMDLSQIKKAFGFKSLDGIIGYELLKDYVVTINYDDKTLNFTQFEQFNSNGKKIKFRLYGDKPIIQSKIMGVKSEVLVDTGDRSSFTLFKKFSKNNNLAKHFSDTEVISGYGVGGPIPAKLGSLPKMELGVGQIDLQNVSSRLPLTKKGFFAQSDLGGSLGNGVLQDFVVSFNYRDQEMTLAPGKKENGKYKFVPPRPL